MSSVHSGQPLLEDFGDFESSEPGSPSSIQKVAFVSLRALEDGDDDSLRDVELQPRRSFWSRILMSVRRRKNSRNREGERGQLSLLKEEKRTTWGKWRWRQLGVKTAFGLLAVVIFFFGIVHIVNVFFSSFNILRDDADPYFQGWGKVPKFSAGESVHLADLTRDVQPIHCHSHNDYWRQVPLYDALRWGCTGVEADVWVFDGELFVGHNTNGLTRDRTFRSMYVNPLMRILDYQNAMGEFPAQSNATKNGVYEVDPAQTLVLLVDFKNSGQDIYPVVSRQLAPFREKGYLTYFDGKRTVPGPITVVATGNAPFDLVTANGMYRDIFFDAPLDRMYEDPTNADGAASSEVHNKKSAAPVRRDGQGTVGTDENSHFDITNSYYASVSFGKSIGWLWFGRISDAQLKLIRGQIQGAKKRGLKSRYWGTPKWPVGLRNHVWEVLVREGVDYLNGDDLRAMTKFDWSVKRHWGFLG